MSRWTVKASPHFWRTALPLKSKYTHEQFALVIRSVREAICELAEKGRVEETGWHDHPLAHSPFEDGHHFESHTFDDDVLVVYFRRESKRTIRMVGIYDHMTILDGSR
ncbi:hypothetical protein [Bifidobacterium jacchi]|uniref:Type II toxin-antitoxin system YafQ family toxin n=1 Tax=Bifidobacterium jacchi TaxID=2490545 RepID=A0A5N5RJM7_9BIFI|nr:hypothetical protein [Bifidobacterium jacchi]KAB5607474.1 hypothetical protein EHS19_04740 [Bifidobacterium jacchi]